MLLWSAAMIFCLGTTQCRRHQATEAQPDAPPRPHQQLSATSSGIEQPKGSLRPRAGESKREAPAQPSPTSSSAPALLNRPPSDGTPSTRSDDTQNREARAEARHIVGTEVSVNQQPPSAEDSALAAKVAQHFKPPCRLERRCEALLGVDCNAATDGPYYYVNAETLEVVSRCGGFCMGGRCENCPPKQWKCATY